MDTPQPQTPAATPRRWLASAIRAANEAEVEMPYSRQARLAARLARDKAPTRAHVAAE